MTHINILGVLVTHVRSDLHWDSIMAFLEFKGKNQCSQLIDVMNIDVIYCMCYSDEIKTRHLYQRYVHFTQKNPKKLSRLKENSQKRPPPEEELCYCIMTV